MRRSLPALAFFLWAPQALAAPLGAQVTPVAPDETLALERIEDSGIRIDGHLDEAFWQRLPAWDEFVLVDPGSLAAPAHATRVRAFYDERGIYLGIDMDQPRETLVSRLSGRDRRGLSRDSINLTLDTSGEGRYGYWFGVNLGDSLMDGTLLPERQFSPDWDGAWYGRSQVTATGWSAEMHIPWGTVAMPKADGRRRLGLYMSRYVAHLSQRWGWPGLPPSVPVFISALQSLAVEDVNPKQQINVFPFLTVAQDRLDDDTRYQLGADLFWRPSSNFQLIATLNPDFGAVESDDVVVNLSATETFFPEKRLFFLEEQQVFSTSPRSGDGGGGIGNTGAPTILLHTRRIGGSPLSHDFSGQAPARPDERHVPAGVTGLAKADPVVKLPEREELQPVELLGAVKATGQFGRVRYGFLAAFEGDLEFAGDFEYQGRDQSGQPVTVRQPFNLPGETSDYGALRLLYEDSPGGPYRAIGFISTAVRNSLRDASTHGLDAHYLAEDGKLKVDLQAYMSDREGRQNGYGGFVDFEYTFRKGLVQRLGIEYNDEHVYLSDLGYLIRNDNLRIRSAHTRTSTQLARARDNQFDIRGFYQRNKAGLFTGGGIFMANRTVFNNLSSLVLRGHFIAGAYDDLNCSGCESDSNKSYRIDQRNELLMFWDSDNAKPLSWSLGHGRFQEELGGLSWFGRVRVSWRPNDRFSLSAATIYRSRKGWLLHQEGRNFTTFESEQWQPRLSVNYFINARQQFRLALQWVGVKAYEQDFYQVPDQPGALTRLTKRPNPDQPDSFSLSQLSLQLRYRWEMAPLSDLFLVYTRLADRDQLADATTGLPSFGHSFEDSYDNPLADLLIMKLRYRFGT